MKKLNYWSLAIVRHKNQDKRIIHDNYTKKYLQIHRKQLSNHMLNQCAQYFHLKNFTFLFYII